MKVNIVSICLEYFNYKYSLGSDTKGISLNFQFYSSWFDVATCIGTI